MRVVQPPSVCLLLKGSKLLVPKQVTNGMALVDNAPFAIQERLQQGCSCCGWSGDPFLVVRVIPRQYGDGYCVIHKQPGEKALLMWTSNALDNHSVDHRIIDYFREARKNWEQKHLLAALMDKHDAEVDRGIRLKEAEMNVEVSKMVGQFMRKHDMIRTKHKIDKKKD